MKIAARIVLFLAVAFLGDRIVSFVALKIIRHSRNQFVEMYEGKRPADILFLGNSRVDANISFEKVQDMTHKVCLNLSLGGNHVLISEALLKDFVQRYGNPKLVVIELSHSSVKPNNMGEMRIFSYCSTNMQDLAQSMDPTYAAFESLFTSLRFNDPAFWRLSVEAFSQPSSRWLTNTIPPEILNQWKGGEHVELPIFEKNLEALTRMCSYADARKIPIKLLIGPYWKEYRLGIANFESWRSSLQKAAGSHPIYDYGEFFFEHPDYFIDEVHLNVNGANYFTQKLVEDKVLSGAENFSLR